MDTIIKRIACALIAMVITIGTVGCLAEDAEGADNQNSDAIVAPSMMNDTAVQDIYKYIKNDGVVYVTAKQALLVHHDLEEEYNVITVVKAGTVLAATECICDQDGNWLKVWYVSSSLNMVVSGYVQLDGVDQDVVPYTVIKDGVQNMNDAVDVQSNIDSNILFYNK